MSQSELRIISESPENRLRVFSELSLSRHRVTSESSHCRLRVSTEFSQSLLHAVSKVVSSYLRVFIIELTLVFWYFLYFKLLQTIEWNLKERKWRIFCTFSKILWEFSILVHCVACVCFNSHPPITILALDSCYDQIMASNYILLYYLLRNWFLNAQWNILHFFYKYLLWYVTIWLQLKIHFHSLIS
jgi:hypothetical protein